MSTTAAVTTLVSEVIDTVASTKNRGEAVTDGSPLDALYLLVAGLFAFVGMQVGLGLREAGAARPHATHELLKKHVCWSCVLRSLCSLRL